MLWVGWFGFNGGSALAADSTAASGFVSPLAALFFGVAAGAICLYAVTWVKTSLKIDDSLDVFAVRGVGGMLGSILVAIFVAVELGGAGYGEGMDMTSQLKVQVGGVAATVLWSAVTTFVIVKVLVFVTGLRVSGEEEQEGLDLTAHGERAYENA